jgi:hypothetical protein
MCICWKRLSPAKERDLNAINLLTKEANPAQLENVYLCTIEFRQEKLNQCSL